MSVLAKPVAASITIPPRHIFVELSVVSGGIRLSLNVPRLGCGRIELKLWPRGLSARAKFPDLETEVPKLHELLRRPLENPFTGGLPLCTKPGAAHTKPRPAHTCYRRGHGKYRCWSPKE